MHYPGWDFCCCFVGTKCKSPFIQKQCNWPVSEKADFLATWPSQWAHFQSYGMLELVFSSFSKQSDYQLYNKIMCWRVSLGFVWPHREYVLCLALFKKKEKKQQHFKLFIYSLILLHKINHCRMYSKLYFRNYLYNKQICSLQKLKD